MTYTYQIMNQVIGKQTLLQHINKYIYTESLQIYTHRQKLPKTTNHKFTHTIIHLISRHYLIHDKLGTALSVDITTCHLLSDWETSKTI